ncbi:hypothetical protein Dsin_031037 [Dipteronia sinensis]|uniref:Uncharacterized protein n=1 Tax=Dipteronia sinensis TaxID=43782 RepID=A0AAE0DRQ7_9ROSI|nr:hypothetical protein Dsin_031037 [Dipteronia sinensis]
MMGVRVSFFLIAPEHCPRGTQSYLKYNVLARLDLNLFSQHPSAPQIFSIMSLTLKTSLVGLRLSVNLFLAAVGCVTGHTSMDSIVIDNFGFGFESMEEEYDGET